MKKGMLKWTEIIYREVEHEDVPKMVMKLLDKYETTVEAEPNEDGTYSVSCKALTWHVMND